MLVSLTTDMLRCDHIYELDTVQYAPIICTSQSDRASGTDGSKSVLRAQTEILADELFGVVP